MSDTTEIIKEARKAGMQVAFLLSGIIVLILITFGSLFGYYIYKSYDPVQVSSSIVQTQDGQSNVQEMTNG